MISYVKNWQEYITIVQPLTTLSRCLSMPNVSPTSFWLRVTDTWTHLVEGSYISDTWTHLAESSYISDSCQIELNYHGLNFLKNSWHSFHWDYLSTCNVNYTAFHLTLLLGSLSRSRLWRHIKSRSDVF